MGTLWQKLRCWIRLTVCRLRRVLMREDTDKALIDLAIDALDDEDYRTFLKTISLVRNLSRHGPWRVASVATGYHYAGCDGKALDLFRLALLKGHADPIVLMDYGHYLAEVGEYEDSITYLERALAIGPEYPTALTWLGDAYAATGQVAKAREAYEASLDLRSGADSGPVLVRLALMEADAENWEAAAALWRQAVKHMPRHEQSWYNLGHSLTKAGRYMEAIPALKKSLRLGSRIPEWTLDAMACCYEGLGDTPRAMRCVRKALKYAPDDADLLELRSRLGSHDRQA